ncbi:MAG: multidrug transporter AcrB, partial [Caulobacteraceae bacterium]|nr:multidrug transporter AcrB [Caulobacteraceae bacterium]
RNLTIPLQGGRFIKLSDVAQIDQGASEERGFARLNGHPVVGFSLVKTNDSSDVRVEDAALKQLALLLKQYPDVTATKVFSTVDQTRASFDSTMEVLGEGMILAAIVVFIFLRNWRATLIAALAMPLSLVPTFAVMDLLGFSLNIITLLALTLVIGILVDDAIVEIENIQKRVEQGATPYRASLIGADSIGLAVIATTATIVGVFTPVSTMPGSIGQFFKEFGITVAVSVLFSLLVARLLTPLLAAYFLKPAAEPHPRKPFEGRYRRALDMALAHPWLSSLIAGVAVIVSFGAFMMFVPFGFQPADDSGIFYQTLEAPPGVSKDDMELAVQRSTQVLLARKGVKSVFAQVGGGGAAGGPGGLNNATLTVELYKERGGLTTEQFRQSIQPDLKAVPDIRIASLSGFGAADVQIILSGEDEALLESTRQTLLRQMRDVKEVANVRPSPPPPGPQLVIRPKPEEAARLGVTASTLAQVLRIATVGDIDANSAKFSQGERRTPIRVRLPQTAQTDVNTLSQLRVPTATGGTTTLSAVADISFEQGPGQIARHDRKRQVTVNADLANGVTSATAVKAVHQLAIMKNLPAGVTESPAGDQEQQIELVENFLVALITGVGIVYVVLILLFRSFFKAMTIIMALPLVIIGVAVSLLLTGIAATMPVFIGILMLFGLAGKNSILLVEFAIEAERKGMGRLEAIHEACRERARPIVMTTLAMIAGMTPTALGIGEGAAWRQPMAVAVIGGLISSTVISLVLVPAIYEIIDRFESWIAPKFSGLITPKQPGDDDIIEEGA